MGSFSNERRSSTKSPIEMLFRPKCATEKTSFAPRAGESQSGTALSKPLSRPAKSRTLIRRRRFPEGGPMAVTGADALLGIVKQKQDLQGYRERHWTGTLEDYMEIVMGSPKVARNAYQRLYDMILSHGVTDYTRQHERYTHYRIFDDPIDGGRDAVFGLDAPLMRLVHNIKSAAYGYGTEKRIVLLHGPVGSSKSTIARLLKKGLEAYSGQK